MKAKEILKNNKEQTPRCIGCSGNCNCPHDKKKGVSVREATAVVASKPGNNWHTLGHKGISTR